ncbi:hypothetical protein [Vibrio tapetis]|uniref:Uncharacterized protein n=1 Tax=Vibrio tapetis subsp. tapetis TaxID=1671868 RepID=A0A2N8ZHT5_9VIBR|nr:hypothetical protein [Vibrio tapetis]SON51473.1 conserved protein of unknown function [Vibrio tapetis subsp. tapetis]SON53536.1 conserved protein of unknown function [Vibrio tapetis subsp. tapetis]
MNTNNYNETLKDEYRTLVVAFFNTVESNVKTANLAPVCCLKWLNPNHSLTKNQ